MKDPNEDAWTTDLQTVSSILPNPWPSARRSSLGITRLVKAWWVCSSEITDAEEIVNLNGRTERRKTPCSDEHMIHFPLLFIPIVV